jgi:AhpC/TSA family/Disulphide bond corrector protein DsbC
VELQGRVDELKTQGLGLVAISYDSSETLKRFADSRGITFPLVSDPGSVIIKRFGLLNTTVDPGNRAYGVPFPGTFIVDRQGVVRARFFEDAYQERNTVASILVRQGGASRGPATTIETPHLRVTAGVSDAHVAPGERVSLVFDVEPKTGMHVYAPGKHTYQVIRATIDPQSWLRVHSVRYPDSEIYLFKPLNERVEVYQKPVRLLQDVTILATPEVQKQLAGMTDLTISGRLEYQACDDKICYMPQSIPVTWTLAVMPLDRK